MAFGYWARTVLSAMQREQSEKNHNPSWTICSEDGDLLNLDNLQKTPDIIYFSFETICKEKIAGK